MSEYRKDLSSRLIHFTKNTEETDAFSNLKSILYSGIIYGTSTLIKGGYNCVCFSETPINCISNGLVNNDCYSKYSPFGIMVDKDWLFSLGGRHVIYETESEYSFLVEENRWRHMTYDLLHIPPIDFTWEREWRIKTDKLILNPEYCSIVVPSNYFAQHLIDEFNYNEDIHVEQLKIIFKEDCLAELSRDYFPWKIISFEDDE